MFVQASSLLADLNLSKHCYNTHTCSFHIEEETSASLTKMSDAHIQMQVAGEAMHFNGYQTT